jgi:hypothetical protein
VQEFDVDAKLSGTARDKSLKWNKSGYLSTKSARRAVLKQFVWAITLLVDK